jgi:hypothetical protein
MSLSGPLVIVGSVLFFGSLLRILSGGAFSVNEARIVGALWMLGCAMMSVGAALLGWRYRMAED